MAASLFPVEKSMQLTYYESKEVMACFASITMFKFKTLDPFKWISGSSIGLPSPKTDCLRNARLPLNFTLLLMLRCTALHFCNYITCINFTPLQCQLFVMWCAHLTPFLQNWFFNLQWLFQTSIQKCIVGTPLQCKESMHCILQKSYSSPMWSTLALRQWWCGKGAPSAAA